MEFAWMTHPPMAVRNKTKRTEAARTNTRRVSALAIWKMDHPSAVKEARTRAEVEHESKTE